MRDADTLHCAGKAQSLSNGKSLKRALGRHENATGPDAKTEAGWRIIPIDPHISDLVANLRANSTDGFLLSGLTLNKYNDRSNAISKRFERLKTKLGYGSDYVFHSLRKGVASQLEATGVPENVAARLLGHEFKTMTYGLYAGGKLPFAVLSDALGKVDWT